VCGRVRGFDAFGELWAEGGRWSERGGGLGDAHIVGMEGRACGTWGRGLVLGADQEDAEEEGFVIVVKGGEVEMALHIRRQAPHVLEDLWLDPGFKNLFHAMRMGDGGYAMSKDDTYGGGDHAGGDGGGDACAGVTARTTTRNE
jgi:hypothetical protein